MYQWDLQTLIVLAHEFIFSNGTVEALDMGIEPFYNVFFYLFNERVGWAFFFLQHLF